MAPVLDRDRILQAFEALGADLAERGLLIEIAVYGGGALDHCPGYEIQDNGLDSYAASALFRKPAATFRADALVLQFAWRRGTDDIDAVVREGFDEAALAPSVRRVAERMSLPPDWLNNAVGMYTPLDEDEGLFLAAGSYPSDGTPGLRTVLAKPAYLLAMKLQALQTFDRGDRDLNDAAALATHLGIADEAALHALYRSVYGEAPPDEASLRFKAVLKGAAS